MDSILAAAAPFAVAVEDVKKKVEEFEEEDRESEDQQEADSQIMFTSDILRERSRVIGDLAELLNVRRMIALALCIEYDWRLAKLKQDWFENPAKVCSETLAGMSLEETVAPSVEEDVHVLNGGDTCEVCGEPASRALASCKHPFCDECWRGHIDAALAEGPGKALRMHCPSYKCKKPLPDALLSALGYDDPRSKWQEYVTKNFVSAMTITDSVHLKRIIWCPNPRCTLALASASPGGFDLHAKAWLRCQCGTPVCRLCFQEQHSPCPCDLARRWQSMSQDSSKTAMWIAAQTKPCPKCKVSIEKDRACNHMTCIKCKYEFCWICIGDWKKHTGENWDCKYFIGEQKGENDTVRDIVAQNARMQKYLAYLTFVDACTAVRESVIAVGNKIASTHLYDMSWTALSGEEVAKGGGGEATTMTFSLDVPVVSTKENKTKTAGPAKLLGVTFWESSELQWAQNHLLHVYRSLNKILDAALVLRWAYVVEFYAPAGKMRDRFAHQLEHGYKQLLMDLSKHLSLVTSGAILSIMRTKLTHQTAALCRVAARLEKDPLRDHLLHQPDDQTARWKCVVCDFMHDFDTIETMKVIGSNRCSSPTCKACRMHGERECRICLFEDVPNRPDRVAAQIRRQRRGAADAVGAAADIAQIVMPVEEGDGGDDDDDDDDDDEF